MQPLYNFFILAYGWAASVAAPFNSKAKKWRNGRKGLLKQILATVAGNSNIIWFHCASLGEFEQGRPVMEALKSSHPGYKILITFFSPSGYEIRKNYPLANYVFYLPADTPGNAKAFVRNIKPVIAIFVKYEFWFNYFRELKKNGTPLFLISASFRPGQRFFRWYGSWFRKRLHLIDKIFVQEKSSLELLHKAGYRNTILSGDTRFDRVMDTAEKAEDIETVKDFTAGRKVLIAGSTWPKDEELIISWIKNAPEEIKIIIAPHQTDHGHVQQIVNKIDEPVVLFRDIDAGNKQPARIMVVNTIGILSRIYKYAHIAYVGGAFGIGLHNILEPAAFGIPVVFGPDHSKFWEAGSLAEAGGGFSISGQDGFNAILDELFENPEKYNQACKATRKFMAANRGATDIINLELDKLLNKA